MGGSCSKRRNYGGGGGSYSSGPGGSYTEFQNRMGMQGSASMRNNFVNGLVGGENEAQDRVLTGLINGGNNNGGGYGSMQYGLPSTCPEGVNQNTALLATAAAIAVAAGVLFRAITLQQAGRRKRRRRRGVNQEEDSQAEAREQTQTGIINMIFQGAKKYLY